MKRNMLIAIIIATFFSCTELLDEITITDDGKNLIIDSLNNIGDKDSVIVGDTSNIDEDTTEVEGDTTDVEEDTTIVDEEDIPIDLSPNLTGFFEGFEKGLNSGSPWYLHPRGEGVMEVVTKPVVSGSKSIRMYLERKKYKSGAYARTQIEYSPGSNAEVKRFAEHFSSRGVRFALYVPSDFKADPNTEILFQYHGKHDAHDTYNNPSFYIGVKDNEFISVIRTIPNDPSHNSDKVTKTYNNIASVKPGHWHYFVVDTHWDYRKNGNGFHKVYMKVDSPPRSSDVILDYKGGTGYNDEKTSYFAFNIYKFYWAQQKYVDQSAAAGVKHREYYLDDIEVIDSTFFKD